MAMIICPSDIETSNEKNEKNEKNGKNGKNGILNESSLFEEKEKEGKKKIEKGQEKNGKKLSKKVREKIAQIVAERPQPLTELQFAVHRRTYARSLPSEQRLDEDPNNAEDGCKKTNQKEPRTPSPSSSFSRERDGGLETWAQTVERVVQGAVCQLGLHEELSAEDQVEMFELIYSLKVLPAGRFLHQLGGDLVGKFGMFSLQNCAVTRVCKEDPIRPFVWAFHALMLGAGVGVNIELSNFCDYPVPRSCRIVRLSNAEEEAAWNASFSPPLSADSSPTRHGCNLPSVSSLVASFKKDTYAGTGTGTGAGAGAGTGVTEETGKNEKKRRIGERKKVIVVEDSREGWSDLIGRVLHAHFIDGRGFAYSTRLIRPPGTPIRSFGGIAAGPEPLVRAIATASSILDSLSRAPDPRMSPVVSMDIMCLLGEAVREGNVRRSALIMGGSPSDRAYLNAKRWDWSNPDHADAVLWSLATHLLLVSPFSSFVPEGGGHVKVLLKEAALERTIEAACAGRLCSPEKLFAACVRANIITSSNATSRADVSKFIRGPVVDYVTGPERDQAFEIARRMRFELDRLQLDVECAAGYCDTSSEKDTNASSCSDAVAVAVASAAAATVNNFGNVANSGNGGKNSKTKKKRKNKKEMEKRWPELMAAALAIPNWRSNSNNSVLATTVDELPECFWDGFRGSGEAYGLINLDLCRRQGRVDRPTGSREDHPIYSLFANASGSFSEQEEKERKKGDDDPDEGWPEPDLVMTNPCVTSDTWVMTTEGARQVKELINKPCKLLVDGNETEETKGFFATGSKPILVLTTREGHTLRLTDDHKVLVARGEWRRYFLKSDEPTVTGSTRFVSHPQSAGEKDEWIEAFRLKPGDSIVLHDHRPLCPSDPFSFDKVQKDQKEQKEQKEKEKEKKMWDGDGTFAEGRLMAGYHLINLPLPKNEEESLKKRFGGPGSGITPQVERASWPFYKGYIQKLFDAGSCLLNMGDKKGNIFMDGPTLVLMVNDYKIVQSLQRMLARVGILSTTFNEPAQKGIVITYQDLRRFDSFIGLTDPQKRSEMMEALVRHIDVASNSRLVSSWDWRDGPADFSKLPDYVKQVSDPEESNSGRFVATVASVSLCYDDKNERLCKKVYDIQVPKVHAFDANGLYVHNCGEQPLGPYETCCLQEIMLPHVTDEAEFRRCALFCYLIAKNSLALDCALPETRAVVRRNMRMGIAVGGLAQCTEPRLQWLDACYRWLRNYDREYSAKKGWPRSARLTTVKPSGTISLLAGTTPGCHPAYARYYVRRVRFAANAELVPALRAAGYDVVSDVNFDGSEKKDTKVVSFLCSMGPDTQVAADTTALDQLEFISRLQRDWSDNAVSCTVYFRPHELGGIKRWLRQHYARTLKSVSFLLHTDHNFALPPLEEITEEAFKAASARLDHAAFYRYLFGPGAVGYTSDTSEAAAAADKEVWARELATGECAGGACPVV